ncbi:hypothetical protein MYAM1_002388 [Malassezia yamatoensis]|uniref:Cation/H+ exchanger transmembrane domain-containing protein n=1 Tax=Malassezia yamatoensis TaxID=253288 RepID=A0AAJ6CIA0_9BASI|nr:hypothetical protein MYAM1_002388 [Malassezia yamatoensis]
MSSNVIRVVHPTPDVAKGIEYWEGIPATVDGVLGGFGNGTLPRVDALGSRMFLLRVLPYLSSTPPTAFNGSPREWIDLRIKQRGGKGKTVTRALDCGAGIGRVTEHSLLPLVDEVHLVEPVHKFLLEAKRNSSEWKPLQQSEETSPFHAKKLAYFHTSPLQRFPIARPYTSVTNAELKIEPTVMRNGSVTEQEEPVWWDVVWCQWCLQHLSEKDLLRFLKDAQAALKPSSSDADQFQPGGVIIIKENVCRENSDGSESTWFDDEDHSVTRKLYERLFSTANLQIVYTETQLGFPEELFDVQMVVSTVRIRNSSIMMDIIETELSQISKAFAIMGGFIVIYGLVSYVVKERLYLSEPLLAITVGILAGPYVLNWVDPFTWGSEETTHEITYQLARLVIGVQVLFTGIMLPEKYLWKKKYSLLVLLLMVMTAAWFTTALLIWGLIKDLTYLEALCIAAAVTPTDPVLANSITSGRFAEEHVEERVRHIILAESGANDGLGFPFLFMAVYLLARTHTDRGESVGDEVWRWFYSVIVYQILLSCVYGTLLGYLARKALRWAAYHKLIDMSNFFSYGFALAMFTLGTAGLFGTDDILACFVAGNSFTWDDWFRLRQEETDFQEILDMLLNTAIFMYIGMIIPWRDFSNMEIGMNGWRVVVLGILVILFRRLPWVMLTYHIIPTLRTWKEACFAGWFGPIGVGAVYYIEVAIRKVPDDGTREHLRRVVAPVVLFCVFSSVLTHGITVPIVYFGPHVVRQTRTLSITQTKTSNQGNSEVTLRQRIANIFADKAPLSDDMERLQPQAAAPQSENLFGSRHQPFSRDQNGQMPPDVLVNPHERPKPQNPSASRVTHETLNLARPAAVLKHFRK